MARPLDRLSALLDRFALRAEVIFVGPLTRPSTMSARGPLGVVHYLEAGSARLDIPGMPVCEIAGPAILFIPRGDAHTLSPDDPARRQKLVCATIDFGDTESNPILSALPRAIVVPIDRGLGNPLESTVELLISEAFAARCGSQTVVSRAFEILIVQMLRHLMATTQIEVGLLAGLSDLRLARALTAIHESPESPWSIERLARAAGMSRTAFAVRFREIVGATPANYLSTWRVAIAKAQLARGRTLKVIATEVGFQSSAALSRAMRRKSESRRTPSSASKPSAETAARS